MKSLTTLLIAMGMVSAPDPLREAPSLPGNLRKLTLPPTPEPLPWTDFPELGPSPPDLYRLWAGPAPVSWKEPPATCRPRYPDSASAKRKPTRKKVRARKRKRGW